MYLILFFTNMSLTKEDIKNIDEYLSPRFDAIINAMVERFDQVDNKINALFKMYESMEKKWLRLNAKSNMTNSRLDRAELNISTIISTLKDKNRYIKYQKKE